MEKIAGIIEQIRVGDRVTISTPHGGQLTGKAVMKGPYGWVLNLGGRYGTPGVATEENILKVRSRRSSSEVMLANNEQIAQQLLRVAKELIGIDIGQTEENEKLRITRSRMSISVTDLENAGKRGKIVNKISIYNLDWAIKDFVGEIEELADNIIKARSYNQAVNMIYKAANIINSKSQYKVEIQETQQKGVDIAPSGFGKIEINGKYVYISADFDSFSVKDKVDMNNEPTCIPATKGKKTAVKMFYRMVKDNADWIKNARFGEITQKMSREGIPYHYYCAMD